MIKGIIFDFNRTVYDPEKDELSEGILELLEELVTKNYKLVLISKNKGGNRREQIAQLGLNKYFLEVQVHERDKIEDDFNQALKVMDLKPEEVLVVGDRVVGEIYLGNKLGMKTVWYQVGRFASQFPSNDGEKPDYIIKKLVQILDFLK